MAKKYEFVNVQDEITFLRETQEEMSDVILDLQKDNREYAEENTYLSDFIRYKGLQEEYQHFCKNATKDSESDLPFPHYTL